MRRTVSGADTGAIFVVLAAQVNEENSREGQAFLGQNGTAAGRPFQVGTKPRRWLRMEQAPESSKTVVKACAHQPQVPEHLRLRFAPGRLKVAKKTGERNRPMIAEGGG